MVVITPEEVREVIDTELSDENISGLLSTASVMVIPIQVSDQVKSEIKKFLAAHLIAVKDHTTTIIEETIGDASVKNTEASSKVTPNSTDLKSTFWGQTAILLDTSGYLYKLGMPPPSVSAL